MKKKVLATIAFVLQIIRALKHVKYIVANTAYNGVSKVFDWNS